VAPARLHHADLRVREVTDEVAQEVRVGTKSASKIAMNSPLATFRPLVERAGLVARAVGAVDVFDVEAARASCSTLAFAMRCVSSVESSSTWISSLSFG
jgi:hypothetical protein